MRHPSNAYHPNLSLLVDYLLHDRVPKGRAPSLFLRDHRPVVYSIIGGVMYIDLSCSFELRSSESVLRGRLRTDVDGQWYAHQRSETSCLGK